jgi:hypothetical protein
VCLQDVKLGKMWEPRAKSVQAQAAGDTIVIPANAARRMIRFTYPLAIISPVGTGVDIFWIGNSPAIPIGKIVAERPFVELWIGRHGIFTFGPFGVVDNSGNVAAINVFELLANTDEESVK